MNASIETLTPEILTPLQELAERSLVITFKGELQRNDINEEFKEAARIALASINLELNTDEDFAVAETNIKACKLTEDKLKNLLDDIISGNEDVSQVKETLTKMVSAFGERRLTLANKVKQRKEAKKREITDAGKKELSRVIALSPLSKVFIADTKAIDNATKNKSKYSVMEECVNAVVVQQIAALAWMEVMYAKNIELIESSIVKFPGIYPDKGGLALEETDKLELIIDQRETKQTLLLKEQEEKRIEDARIAKEKADKAEADRIARENAAKEVEERVAAEKAPAPAQDVKETIIHVQAPVRHKIAPDPFTEAVFDQKPPAPSFDFGDILDSTEIPPPPTSDKGPHKVITVQFNGESEAAQTIIDMLLKIPGVVGADWEYARN